NKSSLVAESCVWFKQRIVAVFLSMMVIIVLTVGMTILTASGYVFSYLKDDLGLLVGYWIHIATITRWLILIGIYFLTVSFLYKYGPSDSKKWKLFSPGATLATILAILTMWGFAYYINHFNTYNKLYGSIGTLIVIIVWLY